MTAYAVANLRSVDLNDEIVEYMRRIDATLPPFAGQFLVHGATPQVMDGDLPGPVVVIGFPDVGHAQAWYHSPEYQAILPLRLRNSVGGAVIVDGVPDGYRAASFVDGLGART
ncbi:Uncharacterized conserved protein, DUF1330 family [Geodermatophilus africanus]|jgi:uncharacterized protein (DUF1330 family)|uniref:Uncharacterized conserved protein, DUF1330 family n=1 Tax=Geodermatophilus africanus TaxID=1137993 RepID=A0A1H3RIA8_9ACTN|nr:DUF1330 domain-containing protein [Geodermatophilus africanus]SDZ24971.1 Uncharacterized conserved protein, DUF1330 family [Geodermatophilus africanus]